jgi:hypothetical protein
VIARPNTRVDVLRDSNVADRDPYGDETETGSTPVLEGEPALIVSERVSALVDGDLRTVGRPIARMRPDVDVRVGDRLRALDGVVYAVETVERPRFSPTRLLDVRLELTRTS